MYIVYQPTSKTFMMMPFIAYILNVVTKKFDLLQQFGNIVWGIWPTEKRVVSTNQYLSFDHSTAIEATQFIQYFLCF